MTNLKAAFWVHGTSVQVQFPSNLRGEGASATPSGGEGVMRYETGTRFPLKPARINWFHFAIPTPTILDDERPPVSRVCLLYSTLDSAEEEESGAWIRAVGLFDGAKNIWEFEGRLSGDHSAGLDAANTWDIKPAAVFQFGLGLTVVVESPALPATAEIVFVGAGAYFPALGTAALRARG